MAFAKFSAFQFASEEFNSDLARLVETFTQDLLKLISKECGRNEDGDENSENGSKNSSPSSSPKGKAPRKKSPATPKRGRPSKEDTDVVLETVSDMRSVSDELSERIEVVRNSSAQPKDSMPVSLDELLAQHEETVTSPENVVEEQPVKKGKAKSPKEPKEKKEKSPKEPKEKKEKSPKEPKEKKEKPVKEPKEKKEKPVKEPKEKKEKPVKEPKEKKEKPVKEPKEKKEKPVKEPKEKKEKPVKEPKAKKGKKGDTTPVTDAEIVQQFTETPEVATHDDDDNDGLEAEIVTSQTITPESFDKALVLASSLQATVAELSEEYDYATVTSAVDHIIGILENVVSSNQNSQEDEIVIEQEEESQDDDKDDMSQPPPEDEDAEDEDEDAENAEGDGDDAEGDGDDAEGDGDDAEGDEDDAEGDGDEL